jgi:hypothetical protein
MKISSSIYFVIALIFATLVTYIDIVLNINFLDIGDRVNYLTRAQNEVSYYNDFSFISFLISLRDEPLFAFVFLFMEKLGIPDVASVRIIIFISTLTTFFVMLHKGRVPLYAFSFLFFFDWFISNYINSLRLALASAVFLLAWFYTSGKMKKLLLVLTPLIHYNFFIVLGIIWLKSILKRMKMSVDMSIIITALAGATFGLSVFIIANIIGFVELSDRYSNFDGFIGISLGPLFFLSLLAIFLMQGNSFKHENLLSIMILTFYISAVFFFPPVSRVLISTIVLILVSGFSIKSYYKYIFVFMILLYTFLFATSGKLIPALFSNF